MNNYKQGCFPQDELEFLGNGNLEKGIAEINLVIVLPILLDFLFF